MTLQREIARLNSLFIDTAPIIYYVEAHLQYGPLVKEVVESFLSESLIAYTSEVTLVEVLPKPIETGNEPLAKKFADFLRYGNNLVLLEISADIAVIAGKLRGRYSSLKAMDAIQIAAALVSESEAFLTNDEKLKQIKDVNVLVLKDYLGAR
ncbi:MAG: type II toxin-antitoxin system VapC family toxin [Fibrobacterota bacterium]